MAVEDKPESRAAVTTDRPIPAEAGIQRGIHWPSCIDRSCAGCMPVLPPVGSPPPRCAPALGLHDTECEGHE